MQKLISLLLFTFVFNSINLNAQSGKLIIHQDEKVTDLLKLKTRLGKENKLKDGFTIQLYYGELKEAAAIRNNYRRMYQEWPSTIEYETPNYKVWVGNFLTRLEADRALIEIKKNYPNAFVFKPERRN